MYTNEADFIPLIVHWEKFWNVNDTFRRVHWDPSKLTHSNGCILTGTSRAILVKVHRWNGSIFWDPNDSPKRVVSVGEFLAVISSHLQLRAGYTINASHFILAEKSRRNLSKSNRNQIVFTIFLDWFGTANGRCPFAVPHQSKNGKFNLISVWFNKISKIFLCV